MRRNKRVIGLNGLVFKKQYPKSFAGQSRRTPVHLDGGMSYTGGRAGSHDPANGRSGGRGEPSPALSHLTAPPHGEGINRCRRGRTARLATARTCTVGETTIPPSCRRIGPGDWDYPHLADIVDAWPELPEAIRTGIRAMVKAVSTGTKLGPEDRASEAQNVRS
jgi:hypothetical protein